MKNRFIESLSWAFGIATAVFTVVPESVFGIITWIPKSVIMSAKIFRAVSTEVNIVISRLVFFILIWTTVFALCSIRNKLRPYIDIKGNNYTIRVEYGDLFKVKGCKRVINFDECFSTTVGDGPGDIKPTSICGQYLVQNPGIDLQQLIDDAKLKPINKKSEYEKRSRYQSGSLVPNGDDLLMAFAPLDENGRGVFSSRDDYLACLCRLWKEIDKYYGQKDVCIPLLGAGITRFDNASGASYSPQELLDIIILSYKLSSHKIKSPQKLRIICKRSNNFSLDKIGENTQ